MTISKTSHFLTKFIYKNFQIFHDDSSDGEVAPAREMARLELAVSASLKLRFNFRPHFFLRRLLDIWQPAVETVETVRTHPKGLRTHSRQILIFLVAHRCSGKENLIQEQDLSMLAMSTWNLEDLYTFLNRCVLGNGDVAMLTWTKHQDSDQGNDSRQERSKF